MNLDLNVDTLLSILKYVVIEYEIHLVNLTWLDSANNYTFFVLKVLSLEVKE